MASLSPPLTRHQATIVPWIEEGRLRVAAALTVLLAQIMGAIGLAWDIQWHISVGRDTFLTPPHILLYTSVAMTGLTSLAMVLTDTWRARSGTSVDAANSVAVFGLFRAPLGFVVAGFGALLTASAAPLDNYWHELYGIDVALWAPFHTMGSLGGFIGLLGMLYAWGSLLVHHRRAHGDRLALPAWGLLATLTLLVGTATVQARPALFNTPMLSLGQVEIALFPVLLGLFVPWLLVLARGVLARRFAPLWLVAAWSAFTTGLLILVPWLVRTGAAAEGLPLRGRDIGASFNLLSGLLMVALVLVATAVTLLLRHWHAHRPLTRAAIVQVGSGAGLCIWLAGVGLAAFAASQIGLAASAGLPVSRVAASPGALLLALPLTVLAAIASAAIGAELAQILRRSPR